MATPNENPNRPNLPSGLAFLLKFFFIVWTFPNTVLGIFFGLIGLCTGGGVQIRSGCLEFYGGFVKTALSWNRVAAMTLGHAIVGQTKPELAIVRKHEQVHVRQYERWGPLFIPVYLGCSLYLLLRGRESYRNNPFEIEAYDIDDPSERRNFPDPHDDTPDIFM